VAKVDLAVDVLVAKVDLAVDVLMVPNHKVEARKVNAHDVRQLNSFIPIFC